MIKLDINKLTNKEYDINDNLYISTSHNNENWLEIYDILSPYFYTDPKISIERLIENVHSGMSLFIVVSSGSELRIVNCIHITPSENRILDGMDVIRWGRGKKINKIVNKIKWKTHQKHIK